MGIVSRRVGAAIAALALSGTLAVVGSAPASAGVDPTTYEIETTADELNENGIMSLREAIALANVDGLAFGSRFELEDGATYTLTRCGAEEDANQAGDLDLLTGELLQIVGNATVRQTCPGERVLDVRSAISTLELLRPDITGGDAVGDGGGVRAAGAVELRLNASVLGNEATGFGGGVRAAATVELIQSQVTDNVAGASGGGIFSATDVELTDSSVTGNRAANQAGGISANDDVLMFDSTVSQNEASTLGGGIRASDAVNANATTIVANRASEGANVHAGSLFRSGSVIALGSVGNDCSITGTSDGNGENVGGDLSCGLPEANDVLYVHPMLASLEPLTGFGGGFAHQPVAPSPVIDHDPAPCVIGDDDQDGTDRPVGAGCDAGAIELAGDATCAAFPDVPEGHPFDDEVCWLEQMGITGGFQDGTFKPGQAVSRQAMAAFLYRFALAPGFTPPSTPSFSDVGTGHPFFREIEWLSDSGIAGGFQDGTFKPLSPVSRQAMAAFLFRVDDTPAFALGEPTFTDVSEEHPFFQEIEWLAFTEVSGGYDDGTFKPASPVSRQAMAAFLLRVASAPQSATLIDGL